ncbi:MAG: sterol desaturase family protein [Bacteroidota bacterium]
MEEFLNTDFLEASNFVRLSAILFVVVFLRYLIVSGVFHYTFYVLFKGRFGHRIINAKPKQQTQVRKEVTWSAITSFIFAISGVLMVVAWQQDLTAIYTDFSSYPWWYIPISLFIALFIHETYYYWLHRWMHIPKVYRIMHKVHHDSIETSSLTSFSFHPLESVLQAIVVPLIALFLPMHIYVLLLMLVIMTLSGTLNHAGVELFPKGWEKHRLGKWLIGATHHDEHHKKFRYNFGLYFTFWDKWMKTESPEFEHNFRKMTKTE